MTSVSCQLNAARGNVADTSEPWGHAAWALKYPQEYAIQSIGSRKVKPD